MGYRYKYSEPLSNSQYEAHYHWEFVEWEDCSVRCGGGTEISKPECVEEVSGKVSASFCEQNEKPEPKSKMCNQFPCETR